MGLAWVGPPRFPNLPESGIPTLLTPPFTQSLDETNLFPSPVPPKTLPFPLSTLRKWNFRPSALFLPPDYKSPGGQGSYHLRFSQPQPWAVYTVGTQCMFLANERKEGRKEGISGASRPPPQRGLGVGQPGLRNTCGGSGGMIPQPQPRPSPTLLLHSWNLGRGFIPLCRACLSGFH